MHTKMIDYQDGDTQLEGYVAWDNSISGARPAVLVAHDWTGRRDFAKSKAEEMASLGYVGFALDMYGKGVFGADGDVEGKLCVDESARRRQGSAACSDGRCTGGGSLS